MGDEEVSVQPVENPFKEGSDSWQIFERLRKGPATNEELREGLNSGPSLVSLVVGKLRKEGHSVANDTQDGRKRYWLGEGGDPLPERKPRKQRQPAEVPPTATTTNSGEGGNFRLHVQPTVGLPAEISGWVVRLSQNGTTYEGLVDTDRPGTAVVRSLRSEDGSFSMTLSDQDGEFVVRELRPV